MSAEAFNAERPRLTGLAYRMLGSRADAEDVVQDAYLRWWRADSQRVENPRAFLTTVVARLCLDHLKSARAAREIYVGPWLPEPVADAETLRPDAATELADDLSFALLLALERLTPLERAAFLLHDVFDASYAEVSAALGRSEPACRQLTARARKAVRERPRRIVPKAEHERLLTAFMSAVASADTAALTSLLTEDVVALTDGGGRRIAALNPIRGADRVARFFISLARKFRERNGALHLESAMLNGQPGLLVYAGGQLDQAMTIDICDGRICAIYTVRNPDKLAGLPS